MNLKTVLITQARSGSTRLPGKVLKPINGKTLLEIHLDRLKKCQNVTDIVVATTTKSDDEIIFDSALAWGYNAFRGSEDDVLDRYYQTAKTFEPDWIVRVTSDCPLIDPQLVDDIIAYTQQTGLDYCSNTLLEQYPDGQDAEVFTFASLKRAWKEASQLSEREHVTPFIKNNSNHKGLKIFKSENYNCDTDYSSIRMTVDEPQDFELIKILVNELGMDKGWREYTQYIIDKGLTKINKDIIRNEGYLKSLEKNKKA